MTGRLDRAGAAVATALRVLPAAGEPGHAAPGELAAGLAIILRARLGPLERLTGAAAFMMALDADDAEALIEAARGDLRAADPAEREAERQRRQWSAYCATSTYRPPLPSPAERRRAERIRLDDAPRARLAAAWAEAGDRDRRDLITRALGRAA